MRRSRRQSRITQVTAVGLVAISIALISGCGSQKVGRSNLGTRVGERDVKASLDGAGFISSEGGAAVVNFSGGKLLVRKTSLELDGRELCRLPADTKTVKVDYTAGRLTVTADGESVLSKELQD